MKHTVLLFLCITAIGLKPLRADSPITSTEFWQAYQDDAMVSRAARTRLLDKKMIAWLGKKSVSADRKVALINALSWGNNATQNYHAYRNALVKKYKGAGLESACNAHELLCLGYLKAFENYFEPALAIALLERAVAKQPESLSFQMILALAKAQQAMDSDWCQVWRVCETVKNNSSLSQDLRPAAMDMIFEYIELYKPECK